MIEGLKSYGEFSGVDIYRHEGVNGVLSGIIFGAGGMLLTARHVVDSRMVELSDFEFFPEYDCREVDIAIREKLSVW